MVLPLGRAAFRMMLGVVAGRLRAGAAVVVVGRNRQYLTAFGEAFDTALYTRCTKIYDVDGIVAVRAVRAGPAATPTAMDESSAHDSSATADASVPAAAAAAAAAAAEAEAAAAIKRETKRRHGARRSARARGVLDGLLQELGPEVGKRRREVTTCACLRVDLGSTCHFP